VIRRVNAEFVPVAVKAGLVNNPPNDVEGALYREIGRSRPAPQGICVVNSAGKVLDWALMFDDDQCVLEFLDHCLKRFAAYPDATKSFPAQRYMRFPSQKLADVEDDLKIPVMVDGHGKAERCPARRAVAPGTVVARLVGRALGSDGKPVADTACQANYVEDRFEVSLAVQQSLARSIVEAKGERFRLPDSFTRLLVSHAYLGQLDVTPLGDVPGSKGDRGTFDLWAKASNAGDNLIQVCFDGKSEAVGVPAAGQDGDGRLWQHEVRLGWQGIIEIRKDRIARFLVVASGSEKLRWGNRNWDLKSRADVGHLPGGHAIDLNCGVRYGIVGEPAPANETSTEPSAGSQPQFPDESRKPLIEALGGPFLVFRDKVQDDLKLSDDQKQKLMASFPEHVQATMQFFDKAKDMQPADREKAMQEHRRKSEEKLATLLSDLFDARQRRRLFQLQLQQAGAFALLGQNELFLPMKITDEQRGKFMAVVREMEMKIQALIGQAGNDASPEAIMPKVLKIRKDYESKISAMLTDEQRRQWKELLGKPFELDEK
jgi:hypothetical protein